MPTPTVTATPDTPIAEEGAIVLPVLTITVSPDYIPPYDRDEWRHWVDTNGNCRNARHDVLVIESIIPVTFREGGECFVISGRWIGPFTGIEVTDASKLDVDHMVPLQNAHISGAWEWGSDHKQQYANHLDYDGHLLAVIASANRSKGSRAPNEWKPPLESHWCDYAIDWIRIKAAWDLAVVEPEWETLLEMLGTCTVEISFDDEAVAVITITPTPIPPAPDLPPKNRSR
jgi:hypothetical protein